MSELASTPVKYVKVLNESLTHNRFQYKLGLNEDGIAADSGEPGSLYFTNFDDFVSFLNYGTLIADVEVPEVDTINDH